LAEGLPRPVEHVDVLQLSVEALSRESELRVRAGKLGNVNNRVGRIVLVTIGVIALVTGGVFAGQGMNLIPGSFMTGNRMWLDIGVVVAVVGIILLVFGLRRPGSGRPGK
jgi:uncharacterized membrane protein YdbT with pleckstrin-like domain